VCKKGVKHWRSVICWQLKSDNKIFEEYFNQTLHPLLILLASDGLKQTHKIEALKRLSFLILSYDLDAFDEYYPKLIEKIGEEIADMNANPNVITQCLLLLKVMLLRFNKLNKPGAEHNLSEFWPIIQEKLVNIFLEAKSMKADKLWLLFDALRFIEFLSLLNIADHHLSQWIFFVDCN
jgi:hypothetical protein